MILKLGILVVVVIKEQWSPIFPDGYYLTLGTDKKERVPNFRS